MIYKTSFNVWDFKQPTHCPCVCRRSVTAGVLWLPASVLCTCACLHVYYVTCRSTYKFCAQLHYRVCPPPCRYSLHSSGFQPTPWGLVIAENVTKKLWSAKFNYAYTLHNLHMQYIHFLFCGWFWNAYLIGLLLLLATLVLTGPSKPVKVAAKCAQIQFTARLFLVWCATTYQAPCD